MRNTLQNYILQWTWIRKPGYEILAPKFNASENFVYVMNKFGHFLKDNFNVLNTVLPSE